MEGLLSSVVERGLLNSRVVGSNPTAGATSTMKSLYLVKATRAPLLLKRAEYFSNSDLEEVSNFVARSQKGGLMPGGVAICIVDSEHDERIKSIKAGGLRFHAIPVLYQINGY